MCCSEFVRKLSSNLKVNSSFAVGSLNMLMQQKIVIALAATLAVLSARVAFSQEVPPLRSSQIFPGAARIIEAENAFLVCLHKVQVAAQSDGLIEKLNADEGSTVSKGETLLVIDSRVAGAELEVARKELEAAQKQAAQTAEVQYAKKAAEVAVNEYNAENELFSRGSSTRSQAERKRLEAERSRLGIEVAEVKHETEILAADVAAAKLEAARVRLDMYNVLAPYDGVIIERLRDEGEWIRAGEPVLRLMHMDQMKVEAMVSLKDFSFSDLQNAPMKVTVEVNASKKYEIPTRVEFVNPEILTGRVRVIARIQNQKVGNSWLLGDGMKVRVELELGAQ
jgi:RND family efflux transporter MFP subunit